jgi:Glu-tRNA(Gln) amidotransferase subunit E-like FAD-binding protein
VDDRIEFVVQVLVTGQGDLRRMVRELAERWPNEPALDIIHAIAIAAGNLECTLSGEALQRAAAEAWRMAGLVGVDLAMMRRLGLPYDTGADLLAYWKVHDRFFLG